MSIQQDRFSKQLLSHIKKTINLADFLETEIGCSLNWYEPDIAAGTSCPMPHHREKKPSFRIKYVEEDGIWIFNCLGCGVKGTIIDFFMDYYDLANLGEAVSLICEKFNIKDGPELATGPVNEDRKINIQKKMAYANISTSNQCRELLRKDYNRYNKWVAEAYRKLNIALDTNDIDTIQLLGYEVSNKIKEK